MTQTTNRFFDEIGRLMNDAAGAAQGAKREFDTVLRNQAEKFLRDMDLVKREEFEAVKEGMKGAKAEVEIYPGTHHGFAFPKRPAYDRDAAERHWERLLALYRRNLVQQ